MLERKNAIVFLAPSIDAVALWRLYMPHLAFPGSSFACFSNAPDLSKVVGNDIVVVQRCCLQSQFDFIRMTASVGMKIIYDLDDNIWDLPDYNPAQAMLNAARSGFNVCMRMVDLITVSTKTLERVVRKNVKTMINARTGQEIPIVVAENRLYRPMFTEARKLPRLTVGWAGSSSHIGDLPLVERALLTAAAEHPDDLDIEFRGCVLKQDNPLLKLKNFRFKLWTPVPEFAVRMPVWGWHVGLAPVTKHDFNDSKSAIKMIEMAYCKTPCLASYERPYDDFCSRDPELRWLLCSAPSVWERKLRELLNDLAMRDHYGERMYDVVMEHYTFDRPHEGWRTAFDAVRAL